MNNLYNFHIWHGPCKLFSVILDADRAYSILNYIEYFVTHVRCRFFCSTCKIVLEEKTWETWFKIFIDHIVHWLAIMILSSLNLDIIYQFSGHFPYASPKSQENQVGELCPLPARLFDLENCRQEKSLLSSLYKARDVWVWSTKNCLLLQERNLYNLIFNNKHTLLGFPEELFNGSPTLQDNIVPLQSPGMGIWHYDTIHGRISFFHSMMLYTL